MSASNVKRKWEIRKSKKFILLQNLILIKLFLASFQKFSSLAGKAT